MQKWTANALPSHNFSYMFLPLKTNVEVFDISQVLRPRETLTMTRYAHPQCSKWCTKGDHKISTDLGVIKTNKRDNSAEVAVPTAETGINVVHEDAKHALSTKPPKEEKKAGRVGRLLRIVIATSGQSVKRLSLILVITDKPFLLYRVLMAWVFSNVSHGTA